LIQAGIVATVLSAYFEATRLSETKMGLPKEYSENIIVWTCYGGVAGGLAQHLFREMKGRGYHKLKVWECIHLTGTWRYRWALVPRDQPGFLRRTSGCKPIGLGSKVGYLARYDLASQRRQL
jgi:hypothetical protein